MIGEDDQNSEILPNDQEILTHQGSGGVPVMISDLALGVPSTRGQTKHPPGGKAVAAAWLPVCAEDLTRRQLLIPF